MIGSVQWLFMVALHHNSQWREGQPGTASPPSTTKRKEEYRITLSKRSTLIRNNYTLHRVSTIVGDALLDSIEIETAAQPSQLL